MYYQQLLLRKCQQFSVSIQSLLLNNKMQQTKNQYFLLSLSSTILSTIYPLFFLMFVRVFLLVENQPTLGMATAFMNSSILEMLLLLWFQLLQLFRRELLWKSDVFVCFLGVAGSSNVEQKLDFQWPSSSANLLRSSILTFASCQYFSFHELSYRCTTFSDFLKASVRALLTLTSCSPFAERSLISLLRISTRVRQLRQAAILLLKYIIKLKTRAYSKKRHSLSDVASSFHDCLQYFHMKLYCKEELYIVIIIVTCLVHLSVGQSDCSPAFTLPNILKDQVSLQYSDGSQQTNSYLFFSGMFSGQPVIGYSISQLAIQLSSSSLNFYLDVQIQDMYIYFYFNSPNFKWTVASVIFWITSRVDILVTKTVLNNLARGQNNTKQFSIETQSTLIDSKSTHVTFLAGIYSSFASNLSVSIYPGPVSSTAGSVLVFVGPNVTVTNITVISVIYNPAIGQFLSSTGTLSYKTVTNQFFNLFNNFLPIYYILTGINSFTLTGTNANNFQFNLQVVNSTILQSSSTVSFDFLGISYVTIGVVTNSVCSPCNNFISNGQCVDSCPSLTYPYTFADNGKACLSCDFRVGQILNTLGNGCNCLPGFQLISANQCVNSNSGNTVCTGMNVIQNGSTCICSPGTYNISGVCGSCPAGQVYQGGFCVSGSNCPSNSNFSPALGRCICDSGYMNISNTCMACQPGQYYDNTERTCKCIGLNQQVNPQGSCVCLSGYYSINGFCISCPSGTVYDGSSCVTQTCPSNQVLVNGTCTCDSTSIAVGSLCIKCNSGTFPNRATNLCDSCIANCVSCLNKVTCSQCNIGFIFDFASLTCLNPNAPQTAAKMVSIKNGFPWYTMQGIITDFIINSTNINGKSKSDLMRMVSLSFSDVNTIPLRIYYSQNGAQFNNIRVAFYYKGLIPLTNFTVQYKFNDPSINLQEDQTVPYQYSINNFQIRNS